MVVAGVGLACLARSRAALKSDMKGSMKKKPAARMIRQPILPRDVLPVWFFMAIVYHMACGAEMGG